ncbi:MAG: DNA polymerase III subunit beta [Armatimonadetes bacterium]|nr:DNA polymerase III subunit beta [Armatimonadota bacterium]
MKIHLSKKDLEKGLSFVSRCTSNKSPLPILSYIMFKNEGEDRLKLSATDLEMGIEIFIKAQILTKGSFCVPAKIITEIISQLNGEDIVLELNESILEIRNKFSKFNLNILPEEDFPVLSFSKELPTIQISKKKIKEMIKNISFSAASFEEGKTILTGALILLKGQYLSLVSTDGRRLAKTETNLKEIFSKEEKNIIPIKALIELSRMLSEEEEPLEIIIEKNMIFFRFNDINFYSRKIEGKYPNYEQVIPKNNNIKVKINKENLINSLKRSLILSLERKNLNLVRMKIEDKKMYLFSNTQDMGSAYEEIEVEKEGENLEIAFNGKFLLEYMLNSQEEELIFMFSSAVGAVLIKPLKNENYIYILMPIKIKEEDTKEKELIKNV